jgi:hypothetical protein
MTRRKARKLIKELQNTLNAENVKKQFWMDRVQGYVQAIFGTPKQSVALPMFGTYYSNDRPFKDLSEEQVEARIKDLSALFQTYQVMIKNRVYLRTNVFTNFNNWAIIGIVAGIVVPLTAGLITVAYIEGQRSESIHTLEVKRELSAAQQRLILLEQQPKEPLATKTPQLSDTAKATENLK